ncbi:MAG: hypothetical protein AAAB35_10560 [Phyllobacterium sp.]|uniref:hypothetical protein n=1 Tax=Phyllobacterium sp. TaxID=1871046 RepID=UPI0030F33C18
MTISPPKKNDEPLSQAAECKAALRAGFEELADQAMSAGWDQYDVALALSELGEQLVQTTAETAGSEADIAIAKALFEIRKAFLTSH